MRDCDQIKQLPPSPVQNSEEAVKYWRFYVEEARKSAERDRKSRAWMKGNDDILSEKNVEDLFENLKKRSSIEGVRQRDFLNSLNRLTSELFNKVK